MARIKKQVNPIVKLLQSNMEADRQIGVELLKKEPKLEKDLISIACYLTIDYRERAVGPFKKYSLVLVNTIFYRIFSMDRVTSIQMSRLLPNDRKDRYGIFYRRAEEARKRIESNKY